MKIQVLGAGCHTCKKLFEITKTAVLEMGLTDEVEYVTDIQHVLNMGLISTPVLAVDDKPALVGFVPDIEKIKSVIRDHIS